MESEKIYQKFGDRYIADENTFIMGIDRRITAKIAERFESKVILETCTGAGFTTIALAKVAEQIFSIDISKTNQNQAKQNLMISGLLNKVDLIIGSSLDEKLLKSFSNIDAAFLDPDWAVTGEDHIYRFKYSNTKPPADLLLDTIFRLTKNVALVLPPYVNEDELVELPDHENQKIYLDGEFALICLYFGNLIQKSGKSSLIIE
jgi:16S rRNA G966 N2-methylase RsmD